MSALFLGDSVYVVSALEYGTVVALDYGPDKDRVLVQLEGDAFFGPTLYEYEDLRKLT